MNSNAIKVVKFGGSSLADARQFNKVIDIIKSDPARRFVVPSAPGKRFDTDKKITDMFYELHAKVKSGAAYDDLFAAITSRYNDIINDLGIDLDLSGEFAKIKDDLQQGASADYAASRGEYLNGLILARCLDYPFLDAAQFIFFDENGMFDANKTNAILGAKLKESACAVVPGFYGSLPNGAVKTFSRGGSDITGAIVARAIRAMVYENWTDVSGLLMADPRIVNNPKVIRVVTYRELRELSYMGASVLHQDAIFPVSRAGIPINVRNTNNPQEPGTLILQELSQGDDQDAITGIAGRKGFTVITIEKEMMNTALGFGRRVLTAFENHGVSFEHMPTGIDTMSIVVNESNLDGKLTGILSELKRECQPDCIDVQESMALIAVVGHRMKSQIGVAAKIFGALASNGINIRMIDQGSSELNIIIGVECDDFESSIRTIYDVFIPNDNLQRI